MAIMFAQTLSLSTGAGTDDNGLRDPSFSSYLNGAEKSFVLDLAKRCKAKEDDADDGEIGVFSADKYFNESLDVEKLKPVKMVPCVENVIQRPIKSMNELKAMSVRSGSSGNSQSALLERPVQRQSVNGAGKVRVRGGYLGSFRCRCVCSDENSVAVEEYEVCSKNLTLNERAAKQLVNKVTTGPVSVESVCVYDQGLKTKTYLPVEDLLPRKSLEVFGRPVHERVSKPSLTFVFETEKKMRLNWEDEFPKPIQTVIPHTTVQHAVESESDSDASSDLFEIVDFTEKNSNSYLSRSMSGSATPTAGYAPSEASIAWSVVTASAADFPITSDNEEFKSGQSRTNNKQGSSLVNNKVTATGGKPRRVSSSFLTCNSQASVNVVNHAHKTHEKVSKQKNVTTQDFGNQVAKPLIAAILTGSAEPLKT